MPEISIIIPCYNMEKFINRCYSSIKNQTFQDFEIIFVDDESKDNTLSILKEIEKNDDKVKVISQKNKRQGGARNTGLKASIGNYISYIDPDDFISPDFLQGLYEAIKEFDCDISMTNVIRYKEPNKFKDMLKYEKKEAYTDNIEKAKINNGNGTGRSIWNKLYKKEFLIKNDLWFREYVSYEDCDFCAKAIYLADKIATTNVGSYFYFVNKKSTMRTLLNKKKQEDKYLGFKLTVQFELEKGIIEGFERIIKYDYSYFGLNFLRIKEKISLDEVVEEWWLFDLVKIFQKKLVYEKIS